jgi:hypothetical protein
MCAENVSLPTDDGLNARPGPFSGALVALNRSTPSPGGQR